MTTQRTNETRIGGLLYFLPGTMEDKATKQRQIASLGDIVDDDVSPRGVQTVVEPFSDVGGIVPGRIIGERTEPVGFKHGAQTWIETAENGAMTSGACGNGRVWVGWYSDMPPGPALLLRDDAIVGHYVKLADGADWLIPVARKFSLHDVLPTSLRLSIDGDVVRGGTLRRYQAFGMMVDRAAEAMHYVWGWSHNDPDDETPAPDTLGFDEGAKIAATAISLNYNLRPADVFALGLLDDVNWTEVVQATLDVPTIVAEANKALATDPKGDEASSGGDPDGTSIDDGASDSAMSNDSAPPTRNSSGSGAMTSAAAT